MKTELHVVKVGDKQTTALTESVPFNRLSPTHCHSCGSTGSFTRQVFHIHGVPESKRAEDHLQESVRQILFTAIRSQSRFLQNAPKRFLRR